MKVYKLRLHSVKFVYTNAGIFAEFWRYDTQEKFCAPFSEYRTYDLNQIYFLNKRCSRKFGNPTVKIYPSGNMYITYTVKQKE